MGKYDNEQRLEWLKAIHSEFKNEDWHNSPVYDPSDFKNDLFFIETNSVNQELIDPSRIIGIEYANAYNCPSIRDLTGKKLINWMDLFYELHRLDKIIDNFKTKEEVIAHIHNDMDKKVVRRYGNHLITVSGQHRLCLAKLFGLTKVKVRVIAYKFDRATFIREKRTEKNYEFYRKNNLVKSNYNTNAQKDNNFINLKLAGKRVSILKELQNHFINQFKSVKNHKFLSLFYPLFKTNETNFTIVKIEDFEKLTYLIARHKSKFE